MSQLLRDAHRYVHGDEVLRCADIATDDRHDLLVASGNRDRDQAGSAEPAVRGVERDPSGGGKIDLRPCMGQPGSPAAASESNK